MEEGLQVHLDGAAQTDAPHEEVMVDEEGEDEWCWEEEFELTDDAVILPPIEQAGEPMFFVCAAGSSGTACSLQGWEPLSELRPHHVWGGLEDGWTVEENALVSGVTAPTGGEEGGEEGEDDEEDEEEVQGSGEEPVRWMPKTKGREDDDDDDEEEAEAEVEVRGWSKLSADAMTEVLPSGRELRPYQLDGLNWLRLHYYLGRNVSC